MTMEPRDDERRDEGVDPDIVPDGAPRGGVTVPDANDTGTMTPPIAGWGETVPEAGDEESDPA
jgi:hypothetical protein